MALASTLWIPGESAGKASWSSEALMLCVPCLSFHADFVIQKGCRVLRTGCASPIKVEGDCIRQGPKAVRHMALDVQICATPSLTEYIVQLAFAREIKLWACCFSKFACSRVLRVLRLCWNLHLSSAFQLRKGCVAQSTWGARDFGGQSLCCQ